MPDSSYNTLKQRWGDPELLRRAAQKRDHLNYRRLSFGEIDAEKRYVISLLPQAHNAYYLGYFEACIAMCGNLLEAFLAKFIADQVQYKPLYCKLDKDRELRLETAEQVQNLSLNELLKVAKRKLSQSDYALLHNVKELRNRSLHGRIPRFEYSPEESSYVCTLHYGSSSSREISIPEADVSEIDDPPEQITAWYCLKYSRYILHCLLCRTKNRQQAPGKIGQASRSECRPRVE